jgi:hypothetical protein
MTIDVHDLLERAASSPPPARWEVPELVAAGRRRQRRRKMGGGGLLACAVAAASSAVVALPDDRAVDQPSVNATPSPSSRPRSLVPGSVAGTSEQRRIAERVASAVVDHLDPTGQHLSLPFGGSADRFNPKNELRGIGLQTDWNAGERNGVVDFGAGPRADWQSKYQGIPPCEHGGAPAGIPITSCAAPVTRPDGTVFVVGRGSRDGHHAVLVWAFQPDGFSAWIYVATVGHSYFLNRARPPLTALPVSTDRLADLVSDPRLRWSLG